VSGTKRAGGKSQCGPSVGKKKGAGLEIKGTSELGGPPGEVKPIFSGYALPRGGKRRKKDRENLRMRKQRGVKKTPTVNKNPRVRKRGGTLGKGVGQAPQKKKSGDGEVTAVVQVCK